MVGKSEIVILEGYWRKRAEKALQRLFSVSLDANFKPTSNLRYNKRLAKE